MSAPFRIRTQPTLVAAVVLGSWPLIWLASWHPRKLQQ